MSEVAVLTGATGDIGRHIARGLLLADRRVVLVVRSRHKLAELRRWLSEQVPGGEVESEICDLSSAADASAAGARIAERHGRVAVLVSNAGIFTTRRQETAEGHELTLATNHLAPFALTAALRPALEAHGAARIVNVGSVMSERARLDLDDIELRRGWGGPRAYARSKLLLAAATFGWARRLADKGVVANVVHPGSVGTGLVRDGVLAPIAWRLMRPFLLTPAQGAEAPLHLALAPDWAARTGEYTRRLAAAPANALALDDALVERAWALTERVTSV